MDKVVDYLVHEQSQVRADRVNRRSFIIIIILIVALVGTNAGWIYYENQFTDISTTYEAEQKIENGAGNADLKYTVATENCADRTAAYQNTQAIIEAGNRNSQAILDKLCQLELDNVKQDNANLRTQLNMANLAASQTAQTAELRTANATQLNNLVSELRSCPIPAQPVYGSQPIFTCGGNNGGCGCSGNAFYN